MIHTVPLAVEQQVGRLDVAVQGPLVVGILQRFGHLHADGRHLVPVVAHRSLTDGDRQACRRDRRAAARLSAVVKAVDSAFKTGLDR